MYFIEAQKFWGRLSESYFSSLIYSFRPLYLWFIGFVLLGIKGLMSLKDLSLRNSLIGYSAALILLPLSSGSFDSINRYVVVAFPLFIGVFLALFGGKASVGRTNLRLLYFVSSSFLLAWYLLLFSNGYWAG